MSIFGAIAGALGLNKSLESSRRGLPDWGYDVLARSIQVTAKHFEKTGYQPKYLNKVK